MVWTEIASAQPPSQAVVDRFNDAVNRKDLNTVAALLTDDTVFENTAPAPDGTRYQGKPAVVEFWRQWFAANAEATFDAEDVIAAGNRVIVRWIYRKVRDGKPWRLRGVDVFTVREGKIAAKLSYVKG
jgi:ketosteroid isomerase-like protein